MIGHWEGEITAPTKKTPILLDVFESKVLLSLPEFGIFGIEGRYCLYRDKGFNTYFEQEEHPITMNLNFFKSRDRVTGVIDQDDDTFDVYLDRLFARPINCTENEQTIVTKIDINDA